MYGNWRIKSVAVLVFSGRRGVGKIMRNTFIDLSNEIFFFIEYCCCCYFLFLFSSIKNKSMKLLEKKIDSGGSLRSLCLWKNHNKQ